MNKLFFNLLLILFAINSIHAQGNEAYYLLQNIAYDNKIPSPSAFFGRNIGDFHVPYDQLLAYIKEVDRLSGRVTMVQYGQTHELRPLYLVTVTSEKNHGQIEQIRTDHKKLVNPDLSSSLNTESMPLVTWMGYSVHGNEASGTNAVPHVLYYLAAGQGASIDSLLNQTVILIDPRINPDGGERFATWVNSNKGRNLVADANSRELNEMWPGGRFNKYWFDLNRDYLFTQHPESQGRIVKFHDWRPNIFTDHHEMGSNSSFFFQPGVPSRSHPLTPKKNIELTEKFGGFQAKALDQIKSLYFTKEGYDDFYYGKGSTFPDVQGAMGILFEQGSSRGHLHESENGEVSFAFTIRNQVKASLATLQASVFMRKELLDYQREFYKVKTTEPTKSYIFGSKQDRYTTNEVLRILLQHEIQVYKPNKNETVNGKTFDSESSFVVPFNQPQHRLIQGIFEKRNQFADSIFYDISAWSLPHCTNIPYAETLTPVGNLTKLNQLPLVKGTVFGKSEYAYLFTWHEYLAPKLAYKLMDKGIRLKVATQALTMPLAMGGEKSFENGTIMISAGLNPQITTEALHQLLVAFAAETGVDLYAVGTGLSPEGIDLGSGNFLTLKKPKPLLLAGPGIGAPTAGEVWHLLDTRFDIPLPIADIETINRIDLAPYNSLILTGGRMSTLADDKIKRWVQAGGTLVCITSAVNWAIDKGFVNLKLKKVPADSLGPKPYGLRQNYVVAQEIPGSIFDIKIDNTHPLFYGYSQKNMSVFRDHDIFVEKVKNPYTAPAYYTDKPLVSGYITAPMEKLLKNSLATYAQTLGRGKVVVIMDNPNFRAFWYGTNKLFMNSLFFGPQINNWDRDGE